MLDYPWWEGDLAGMVSGKDIVRYQGLLYVLFNLGAVLRLFHMGSLLVVLFRRQRMGRYVAVRVYGSCLSML